MCWLPPSHLPLCSGRMLPTPLPPSRAHTWAVTMTSLAREGEYYSIISFQRGELALPPFDNPPRFLASYLRAGYLSWGYKGAVAPLKILLKYKNIIPLPYHEGTNYISLALREGAGGGKKKAQSKAAGEARGWALPDVGIRRP